MFTSTATVGTTRAARYRDQLASHGAGLTRHTGRSEDGHTPRILGTTIDNDTVVISLRWGRCTITATSDALQLAAEADTPDGLAKIQSGIAARISKIGRRDNLSVDWTETVSAPAALQT